MAGNYMQEDNLIVQLFVTNLILIYSCSNKQGCLFHGWKLLTRRPLNYAIISRQFIMLLPTTLSDTNAIIFRIFGRPVSQ